jgi:hypothetical protein
VRTPLKVMSGIICGLLVGSALADTAQPASEHVPGVWQKHEYSFAYMGFTSTYSCDGLAGKLKTLLIAAGARADAKARSGACASGFGRPDKFARAGGSRQARGRPAGRRHLAPRRIRIAKAPGSRHRGLRIGGAVQNQSATHVHDQKRRQ